MTEGSIRVTKVAGLAIVEAPCGCTIFIKPPLEERTYCACGNSYMEPSPEDGNKAKFYWSGEYGPRPESEEVPR